MNGETDVDARTLRERALARSRQILEMSAKQKKRPSTQKPSDVLQDIEGAYNYEPWDVALVAALTALLHPKTRVPQALREKAARITRERRRVFQWLRTAQKRFMTGDDPIITHIDTVLAPRPAIGVVYTSGRPSTWVLDEFTANIMTILGRARVRVLPTPPLRPLDDALIFGEELLKALGINLGDIGLEARAQALLRTGDLPPEPDDEHPLAWADGIARRLCRVWEDRDILRRIFVPSEELPIQTLRYRVRAGTPDIFARAFRRRRLPPPTR